MLQRQFSFTDYARNVREAAVGFMVTGHGRGGWAVSQHQLESTVLQYGTVAASMIADGHMVQTDSVLFVLQSSLAAHRVFLNGNQVGTTSLAVLVPGCEFLFTNQVPHRWISVSVPLARLPQPLLDRIELPLQRREATLFDAEAGHFADLVRFTETAAGNTRWNAAKADPGASGPGGSDDELIDMLTKLVDGTTSLHGAAQCREPFHYHSLVRRSLAGAPLDAKLHVEDLCRAGNVEERTLRRAFHRVLRMPPLRYLKLRQLNQVHAALTAAEARGQLVTDILTRYGVTELGRFATEYRSLFGEPPSQTARRGAVSR